MKLLYCDDCKTYPPTVEALVYFSARVRVDPDTGKLWVKDYDAVKSLPRYPVNAANPQCPECSSLNVKVVERDECPHDWDAFEDERRCRICGKREKGRVEFD